MVSRDAPGTIAEVMVVNPVLRTRLCDLLGIEYPIVQAGMGDVATADLVAAVSQAGGLGVLGAATWGRDEIERQVRQVRSKTSKPFGIDILLPSGTGAAEAPPRPPEPVAAGEASPVPALPKSVYDLLPEQHRAFVHKAVSHFDLSTGDADLPSLPRIPFGGRHVQEQIETILDLKVPVFASGLGNPAPYIDAFHARGTKVIGLVGNVKHARRIADGGADIVVAQGTEAGGHTGRIGTMALLPQVIDAVAPTAVLAAGGIGDGRGVAASLAMGADGVWVGTAFLVAQEAAWPSALKQRVLAATEEDTRVTRLYTGKTLRSINNPLIEYWESEGIDALPMGFQYLVSGPLETHAERLHRPELMMNPAGQIAGLFRESRPAVEILHGIVQHTVEILSRDLLERVTAGGG